MRVVEQERAVRVADRHGRRQATGYQRVVLVVDGDETSTSGRAGAARRPAA